jgi:hypothetical protein
VSVEDQLSAMDSFDYRLFSVSNGLFLSGVLRISRGELSIAETIT